MTRGELLKHSISCALIPCLAGPKESPNVIRRHYTIIRVIISIVTVIAFVGLIVSHHEWIALALFAGATVFNLYLKYKGNRC